MSALRQALVSTGMAIGNVVARERDQLLDRGDDGRPLPVKDRAPLRMKRIATESVTKLGLAQAAPTAVREIAKRLGQGKLKVILGALGRRPAIAASSALVAFDVVRDTTSFARGHIDGQDLAERMAANTTGMAGSAGGAYAGGIVGTIVFPIAGSALGSVIGGVVGGIAGDTYGRHRMRRWLGRDDDSFDDLDTQIEDALFSDL